MLGHFGAEYHGGGAGLFCCSFADVRLLLGREVGKDASALRVPVAIIGDLFGLSLLGNLLGSLTLLCSRYAFPRGLIGGDILPEAPYCLDIELSARRFLESECNERWHFFKRN